MGYQPPPFTEKQFTYKRVNRRYYQCGWCGYTEHSIDVIHTCTKCKRDLRMTQYKFDRSQFKWIKEKR